MRLQEEISSIAKSKIQQWRSLMDEMEVQLALGKAEAKDMIDQEKKNLSTYFEQQKAHFTAEEKAVQKNQLTLKSQLEDLYLAMDANLGKSKRSYDLNKKLILNKIYLLEARFKTENEEVSSWLGQGFDALKNELDEYRIVLALSTFETWENILEPKAALQSVLQEVMDSLTKQVFSEDSKVGIFLDEISESLEHLKRAFTEVLN